MRASLRYAGRNKLPTTSLRYICGSSRSQSKRSSQQTDRSITLGCGLLHGASAEMTAKNFYRCWSRFGMSNSSLHPVGDENIRFVRSFSVAIGGPDEALPVGQPIGGEICSAVARDLMLVLAVRVHYPDLQISRANQAVGKQVLVVGDLLGSLWLLRAVDDFLAIVRKKSAAVVA